MARTVLYFFILFIAMVILQAVVFNRIWLFNVAIPLVFIFFFLSLPEDTDVKLVLTLSFILGISVDIFSDTLGLNALCCTISAGLRRPIIYLYVPRDESSSEKVLTPSTMGRGRYMKYLITMTTLYCTLFFVVLSTEFFSPGRMLLRIAASSLLTFILILAFSNFLLPSADKRK